MRHLVLGIAISVTVGACTLAAQTIPVTVAQAESEAIGFPHAKAQDPSQPLFAASQFAGISDRRCLASTTVDRRATGSLRSGDIIVRGGLINTHEMKAGEKDKLLWIPLHAPSSGRLPLVLRAARIDHPADSLRLTVAGLAHGPGPSGRMYGYPSLVSFPKSGQWLVVATAGDDWGCFVVDVVERKANTN
ncbi:MAG: hypothetical protein JWM41_716 [Gemmatimonadetes bacterium]|nr:hypothetical protein [Gemmatimonadota bacterium]